SVEKSADRACVPGRPCLIENISDHGEWTRNAKSRQQVVNSDDLTESAAFKLRGKIPVGERCIEFTLDHLAGQQRRRAVNHLCLFAKIDALAFRGGLQEKPALVNRSSGDSQRFILQISEGSDWRILRNHHSAERRRVWIEKKLGAEFALVANPEPIRCNEVD